MKYKDTLPIIEGIVYYALVICSLGTVWMFKIILKKAFAESLRDNGE